MSISFYPRVVGHDYDGPNLANGNAHYILDLMGLKIEDGMGECSIIEWNDGIVKLLEALPKQPASEITYFADRAQQFAKLLSDAIKMNATGMYWC